MEHQVSIFEAIESSKDLTVDRYGRMYESPFPLNKERCENCQSWTLLPTADQPPCGWGVKGICANGVRRTGKIVHTSKSSYCDDFKENRCN